MKKNFLRVLFVVVIIFASVEVVYAYSNGGEIFGGRIVNTKATEIEDLESSGYQCDIDGTTITIDPIKGHETYLIPSNIRSKTNREITSHKWIMGKFSGTSSVTCTKQCGETECTSTVNLNTVNFFGNS